MTNIIALQHLSFERSHDGEEVIVSLNLHGAPTRARLSHHAAIIAVAELLAALKPVLETELAHGHPGEPSSPNPAPDASVVSVPSVVPIA